MGLTVNYVPYEHDYFYGWIENAKTTNGRKVIFSVSGTKDTENEANAQELVRRWNAFEKDGLVDELVDAFKELAATFVGLPEGSIGGQAMKKAEAAIAEAT